MPTLGEVHIDTALTAVSIAYRNEEYVADQVMPPLPVANRSDKYFIVDREAGMRASGLDANGRPLSVRSPGAEAQEVQFSLSTDTYFANEYAKSRLVTYAEIRHSDAPLQPLNDAAEFLTDLLQLDNEMAVAYKAMNGGLFPTAGKTTLTTGGSGTSWLSYTSANSLPFSNFSTAKNYVRSQIMRVPNALAINYQAAEVLSNHPTYIDRYKYTTPETATRSGLNPVIRGLKVVEGSAVRLTNVEGATAATGDVWVDDGGNAAALVYYASRSLGPKTIHFGRVMEAPEEQGGARGFVTRRYEEPKRKAQRVEVCMTRDWKLIAVDGSSKAIGGYLMKSVIV